jgi:hypothetical protein
MKSEDPRYLVLSAVISSAIILRGKLGQELEERVDFSERLLAQQSRVPEHERLRPLGGEVRVGRFHAPAGHPQPAERSGEQC